MKSRNQSRRPSSLKQKRRSFFSWLTTDRAFQGVRKLRFESLEDRRVLTTTLFLDFGSGIGMGNTLSTTTGAFRNIFGAGDASFGGSFGTGSDLTSGFGLAGTDSLDFTPLSYDYNGDGFTNNADITALANAVIPIVQRALEPFDINVVIASATNFADAVASVAANAGDPTGQFDAYNFIMDIRSNGYGGGSVGDSAPVTADGDRADGAGLFGIAGGDDLFKQFNGGPNTNTQDEATLTFSDTVFNSTTGTPGTALFNLNFAYRVAYTATHEAFHTFTAVHTTGLTSSGDVIRLGSNTRENPFIVTRYDLTHPVTEPNNYLLIANDPDIGLRDSDANGVPDLAFVSGTGAHDRITLANGGGSTVNVTVQAYSDVAKTVLISTESYSITLGVDTEGEILIDAGINSDDIVIDGTIAATFRVRGGEGRDGVGTESDRLIVTGNGTSTGSYLPVGTDGGIVNIVGGASISATELEPVEFSGFANFTFTTANAADVVSVVNGVGSGGQAAVRVTGTSGGVAFEQPTFFNVTNLVIDLATNDGGAVADDATVNVTTAPLGISNITINGGAGNDVMEVTATPAASFTTNINGDADDDDLSIGGNPLNLDGIFGSIIVNGGTGTDTLEVLDFTSGAADGLITITNNVIGGIAVGTISYVNIDNLIVDPTDNFANNLLIRSLFAGVTLTIFDTSTLVDTVNIGDAGSLDPIQGLVIINDFGASTPDVVNYNDNADASNNTYVLSSGGDLTRNGVLLVNLEDDEFELVTLNAGTGSDTITVTPSTAVTFNVNGNTPAGVLPGDVLIYDGSGNKTITGTGAGQITGPGVQPVNFTGIEQVAATGVNLLTDTINIGALPGGADGNPNNLRVDRDATGALIQFFFDGNTGDATPEVLLLSQVYANTGSPITINGAGDNDTLTIDNSLHLINRTFNFAGAGQTGAPGDVLVVTGNPGSVAARETYLVGATQDAGTWVIDPDGNRGPGVTLAPNGDELTVAFTGLEPVDTDTPAAVFDVILPSGGTNDDLTIDNVGSPLNGFAAVRVLDNAGTFETFRFARKDTTRIMANLNSGGGVDTFRLNYTTSPATASGGAFTLETYGHIAPGVLGQPADDSGIDQFALIATPVGTTNNLFGNNGNDRFNTFGGVVPFGINSMAGLNGTINIDGGAGAVDEIGLNQDADAGPVAVTLTATQLVGAGPATINYTAAEVFTYRSTPANDTIDVISTQLGTTYLVNADGGSDTVTVGNSTADFNTNTFDGSLAAIAGTLTIAPDSAAAVGVDTLNVDASGQAALAGIASITNVGSQVFTYDGFTNTGNSTRLAGFAPVNIDYRHDATAGGHGTNAGNRLEFLNIRTSTGNDVVNVNDTTAVTQTTLDTRQGNDTVTINGDNLSAANLFRGLGAPSMADGNDFFTLNIAANLGAGAFAPLTSVQIEGNNQLAGIDGRDRLLINDNSGAARNLNYHYLTAGSGDIDIEAVGGAGLAGGVVPALALQVRTMESVSFNAAGANNDTVLVTGIAANDDILTVIPGPVATGTALIYRGGTPYLGTPPATLINARPGVSGGNAGPDLAINGMAPAGITADGGGNAGVPGGDRLVVHAISETALNNGGAAPIFSGPFAALGAGIIQPSAAVNAAFDDVVITDALVSITNNVVGLLLPVNVATPSFVQNGLPLANQQAALLVNGGDEAGRRLVGPLAGIAADDFVVNSLLNNFNIKVNGNLPDPAVLGPDGLPVGDRLVVSGPGSLNIFSDKATPPNVSLQYSGNLFNVQYSSIERVEASPGNGTVNLIGDNNNAAAANNQTDNFVVRGRNVDQDFVDQGYQEMTVAINGSSPILINSVQFLKVYGDDLAGSFNPANLSTNDNSVDTLDIRAYADNTPRGWGVDVFFNEGAPAQSDGLQQDLIIYHTATGVAAPPDVFGAGTISENIVVQPTGPDNGEIRSTNATGGSLVYVLSFVNNTDIIFVDDDGVPGNGVPPAPPAGALYDALSDVDTLTLRGTDPNNGYTSGNDRFDINITAALGTPATPVISVRDNANGNILYRVREFRTQTQVAGVTDPSDFLAQDTAGNLAYTTIRIDPRGGDDVVQVDDPATPAPLATDTLDGTSILLFTSIDAGEGNDRVNMSRTTGGAATLPNAANLVTSIYGSGGNDILIGTPYADRIYGGAGDDTITGGIGNDQMYGEADSDTLIWNNGDNNDLMEGGTGTDRVIVNGSNAAGDIFTVNPNAGDPTRVRFDRTNLIAFNLDIAAVENLTVNGLIGADSVTIADMATTELRNIDVDFGSGDAVADSIVINGRNVSDQVDIRQQNATTVAVTGLKYDIRVINAVAAQNDDFVFNGNAGNDSVVAADDLVPFFTSTNVAATNHFTLNGNDGDDFLSGYGRLEGGNGNDTLFGSLTIAAANGAQLINGGAGNDLISGGAGIDFINGDAGEDTILANFDGSVDVFDGGADFDTVIIQGTSGDDRIDFMQDDLAAGVTPIRFEMSGVNGGNGVLGGAGTETDNFVVTGGLRTVEEVRIIGGAGDDVIRVAHSDAMIVNARTNLSVRITVDGGDPGASDRLTVTDDGLGDTTIHRVGGIAGQGSYAVGALAPVVYTGVEYTSLNPINSLNGGTGTDGAGRLFVFKHDSYEANNSLPNATYLGTDYHVNLDPVIDPGADAAFNLPGDEDWYRVVASVNGTLDIRAFFREQALLTNGRAGLPANGNLDLQVYDASGNLVQSTFGGNDGTGTNPELETNPNQNERVRIPAVAGQTYYIRIYGAGQTVDGLTTSNAVNVYNLSVINTAAPVPFDIELLDTPVNTTTNSTNGAPGATAAGLSSDTGRSQRDNITYDNDPTIRLRVPGVVEVAGSAFLGDLPGGTGNPPDEIVRIPFVSSTAANAPSAGFRVPVFVTENGTSSAVLAGYAQPVAGSPGLFTFTFANDALGSAVIANDGSYYISARVEMIDPTSGGADTGLNQGFGDFATSLEVNVDTTLPTAFFGTAASATDGLHPNSDTGVANSPASFNDRITSVTLPTFWGVAEADTVIRLYADLNNNGVVDATDVQIATTVTLPYDGTNQYPNGSWQATSFVDLNNPAFFPVKDGLRTILLTAEDVAGNLVGPVTTLSLQIFIDTQGPQVTDVDINNAGNPYDLFDPKPSEDGPTPLVNSLVISLRDLPARAAGFLYDALNAGVAATPGMYQVKGDYNGIIPIQSIVVVNNAAVAGNFATATVQLNFVRPLPDDRFTLTILDGIVDPVGNKLDGESNVSEPQENPTFPSGNGITGGNFVARFTVDSRPEVGTWGAGAAWIDTNGNTTFDQNNPDFTNRDITYYMGYTSDNLFAGNFVRAQGGTADGFDKLAAYGRVGNQWRVLVDVDNDGVITPGVDIAQIQPGAAGINGVPVAGDFDGNPLNGDEFGVFTGTTWYFDTNHDWILDVASAVPWTQSGYPVVGNFDGVAGDDLATYRDNTFFIDFGRNGSIDRTFRFGFPTPNNRPVSADMDRDGNDDLGLFVPNRAGVSPHQDAEWYILVSGGAPIVNRIHADPIDGVPVIDYKPVPFGNDMYIQFGDQFGLPILGNFDPPVTPPSGATTALFPASNPNNPLDVNNDGFVTSIDALLVLNSLNANGTQSINTAGFHTAPFLDTDRNNVVSARDVLLILNSLNASSTGSVGGEGEGEAFATTTAHDAVFSQLGGVAAPAASSADAGILSLLADDQVRAKRNR